MSSITIERLEGFTGLLVEAIEGNQFELTSSQWTLLDKQLTVTHALLRLQEDDQKQLQHHGTIPEIDLRAAIELLVKTLYGKLQVSETNKLKQALDSLYNDFTTGQTPIAGPVKNQTETGNLVNNTVKAIKSIRRQVSPPKTKDSDKK